MTEEQIEEIKVYFKNKKLPKEFEYPGSRITNCQAFVSTQLHRIEQGVPLIRQVSFDHLVTFRKALEK